LLREVPKVGDVDFTVDRLVARTNRDLADDLGNLVHRVVSLVHRYRDGRAPAGGDVPGQAAAGLIAACDQAPALVAAALDAFDFRRATAAVWVVVDEANRYVESVAPWRLARAERAGDISAAADLDAALAVLLGAGRTLADLLAPFLPDTAERIEAEDADEPRHEARPVHQIRQQHGVHAEDEGRSEQERPVVHGDESPADRDQGGRIRRPGPANLLSHRHDGQEGHDAHADDGGLEGAQADVAERDTLVLPLDHGEQDDRGADDGEREDALEERAGHHPGAGRDQPGLLYEAAKSVVEHAGKWSILPLLPFLALRWRSSLLVTLVAAVTLAAFFSVIFPGL
jgi:hypothetical protein